MFLILSAWKDRFYFFLTKQKNASQKPNDNYWLGFAGLVPVQLSDNVIWILCQANVEIFLSVNIWRKSNLQIPTLLEAVSGCH